MSEEFRNEIPSFGVGSDVANLALTKVGCKYSQEHRYEEGYYDCSSLVQRLYQEVGISLPAIASTQGEFMVTHGLEVTEGELEPGDLIFILMSRMGSSAIFPMWQFMLVMAEWYMQPTADVE